jgi:hypothetical protein
MEGNSTAPPSTDPRLRSPRKKAGRAMIGKLYCALVRLMGGAHVWRRLRKGEREAMPVPERFNGWKGADQWRVCKRCDAQKLTKARTRGKA